MTKKTPNKPTNQKQQSPNASSEGSPGETKPGEDGSIGDSSSGSEAPTEEPTGGVPGGEVDVSDGHAGTINPLVDSADNKIEIVADIDPSVADDAHELADKLDVKFTPPEPESALDIERQERETANAERVERNLAKADEHDEKANKLRAQNAAQKNLANKEAAKREQNLDSLAKAEDLRLKERAEKLAVEPSLLPLIDPDPVARLENAESRIDRLERASLTLARVLLDSTLSPDQRGIVKNCVALIKEE